MFYSRRMEPLRTDSFEQRIVAALEREKDIAVPVDFAARVAASLPAVRPARRKLHAARIAAVLAAVVLLVAMLWAAPRTSESFASIGFQVELGATVLLALLAGLMARAWRNV